jgi:hypothetical protein
MATNVRYSSRFSGKIRALGIIRGTGMHQSFPEARILPGNFAAGAPPRAPAPGPTHGPNPGAGNGMIGPEPRTARLRSGAGWPPRAPRWPEVVRQNDDPHPQAGGRRGRGGQAGERRYRGCGPNAPAEKWSRSRSTSTPRSSTCRAKSSQARPGRTDSLTTLNRNLAIPGTLSPPRRQRPRLAVFGI